MAIDINQLMQLAQLTSALASGAGGNVPAQAGAQPQQASQQMPQQAPVQSTAPPQQVVPQQIAPVTNPPLATQPEKSWWDRSAEWLSGGMKGDSPEAIADRENFRRYNTIMSLGTALGGAWAGGEKTGVGQVSNQLNQYAQGNIMASNAEEKEGAMNKLMQSTIGAITPQRATEGSVPGTMPAPTNQGAPTPASTNPMLSSASPVTAPTSSQQPAKDASSISVADLEQRMKSLFG